MKTIIQENTANPPAHLKLTATAEDYVYLTDFADAGLSKFTAFAFLDDKIGMRVIVEETLSPDVLNATINTAVERLIENKAKRFVVLDARGELYGGAA